MLIQTLDNKTKDIIKAELEGSDLMNIFGLVNFAKVYHAVQLYSDDEYTEQEVKHAICRMYDYELNGGVQFKDKDRRNPDAICGTCGVRSTNESTGYCANDHDNWVELRDFEDKDLESHIKIACNRLQTTPEKLYDLFF